MVGGESSKSSQKRELYAGGNSSVSEISLISLFSNMSSSSCLSSCLDDILLNLGGATLAVETPSYYKDAPVAYGPLGSLFYFLLPKTTVRDFDPWGTCTHGHIIKGFYRLSRT